MNASLGRSPGSQLAAYWRLMRFHKPIGIYLLLWPTLWGLWLAAGGLPPLKVLVVFVLGTVLMRAAGCVINDYADRDFDGHVARTRDRPIAAGLVRADEAVRLAVVLALIAFGLTTSLHRLQVLMLAVPAVIIAAAYPFMKRFISVPQAVLGLAFSWGIPMAYAAVRDVVPVGEVAALMLANLCWVVAYDTYYAMADREDDLKLGLKSSAIFFGRADRALVIGLQLVSLALLAALGAYRHLAWPYFAGLAGAALTVVHQARLTRNRDPAQCFKAFLNNNLFGALVFLGLLLALM
ncbi:MAG: 4-hydroxybenzoate octaprenyltransferase [Hydrocarboniphaga sp.]|uniref:4-hydroxybenzoate octaprenyltransferase n=1 Tax=Hydrocarboniphaga sp. TaxID=2033016 RepID=UPI0026382477|nr:4-hydroxybenzoate octaprenyltransferase [Hydrocarboniphaga sp.]MDB5972293.1 4-hydroxybenzoate octaprenyltransferase [Hydrocarboniphaga sp.]